MSPASAPVSRRFSAPVFRAAPLAAVILLLALMEWTSGAWHSDFDAHPDEAAHLVSSLMVRDYVTAGFPGSPLGFAKTYYVHYPKVALGHWPPLFHTGEAAWMLIFGRNRAALLAFVATISCTLLLSIFVWARRECGALPALLAAVALALPPFMQVSSWSVSPNIALGLFAFWAAVFYGKYLESSRTAHAVGFALFTIAGVCVHGRGAAVALIPVVVPLLRPRPRITRVLLASWAVACAILLIVPPWMGQAFPPSLSAAVLTLWRFLHDCWISFGWPVFLVAILGVRIRVHARWLPMIALPVSALIFQAFVNVGWEDRFLMTAAPGIAALFAAGVRFLIHLWSQSKRRTRLATAALAAAGFTSWIVTSVRFVEKPDLGYHRLPDSSAIVYLTVGDPLHEGALVSEVALRDPHLNRIVLRASKVLFLSTWLGSKYRLLFPTPEAVSEYLDQVHVEVITLQQSYSAPHSLQLEQALRLKPQVWSQVQTAGPAGVRIFHRTTPVPPGPIHIRIDMRGRLGGFLELDR